MVSRRFVMNRRLFRIQSCLSATPFRLLRLVKRKVWPLPCSHTLSQPWLCSRGDLPIAFRETVIFPATFPSLTASPLSFVAVLTRSSCPIVPMMQSTLPNTPRTSILLLPQPRRSVAPLGTSSPSCKRLPHRLCVAVKFGVCVCECGKVTALKASADHRFASCAAMQGFQPLCFAPMMFRTAQSGTCTMLCLCRHHLLLHFCLSF